MKKLGTQVHIYYDGKYVCSTNTRKDKPTSKKCLEYFIACGKTETCGFYTDIKNQKPNFSDSKFKALFR